MKKIFTILALIIAAGTSIDSFANTRCEEDWKEKIRSEKIAFLTMEMNITPEEAQSFWPVYNQVEQEKDAALAEVIKTYKELNSILEQNKAAEIENCLNAYHSAQDRLREIESKAATQYKAVLPVEKVAKLYVGEEKFRRQHIRKLRSGQANK